METRTVTGLAYFVTCVLPYISLPIYLILIVQRGWAWAKLYNPAVKLVPGPLGVFRIWSRQYRPTVELFPNRTSGRARRLWRDFKGLVLFSGVFRSDKPLWLGSWLFHVSLLLTVALHARHLFDLGMFLPQRAILPLSELSAKVLLASSAYLLIRRLIVRRVREITSIGDYVAEALVVLVVITGMWPRSAGWDAAEVKSYLWSVLALSPEVPSLGPGFLLHLLLSQILLLTMPFSHLMHFGGIFLSRRFLASPDSLSGDV